ncbi:MAG: NADP-dependent isocitrate dehydrogenase [Candidatus Thermoplasmatota archaeon]|nr:NADP-dependent isocitrate dehydrogenase [Candidatus Thermoplasmatota archaeon]
MSNEERIDGNRIIYTRVDEAPALATYSLLPVIKAFTGAAGVKVETRDISLSGRTIAKFPDHLSEDKRINDDLEELGKLVKMPEANVIKLPCISASIPQLKATIKELQGKGYALPDYPDEPKNDEERTIKTVYDKIKGSAVNPVLREGNSDRRAPASVKNYARKHPHSMAEWKPDNRAHVSSMASGDLRSNERSLTIDSDMEARIEYTGDNGDVKVLKDNMKLPALEIVDTSHMSVRSLRDFIRGQIEHSKEMGVLFSIHLKATMMKVSDPIIFGHVVSVFFADVFEKHEVIFKELGINPNNGLGDLYTKIASLPEEKRLEIVKDIEAVYAKGPELAMVNSDKGLTNLHVPSDVIIDASMPAAIRAGGRMYGKDGTLKEAKFVIPDSSYSGVYRAVVDFCRQNGAFDPRSMGSVQNVGLMAQKAEEYGSHDKTFSAPGDGKMRLVASSGEVLMEQDVEKGDIFRMCEVKDPAIKDWVKLAVGRAIDTKLPVVFWLDEKRPHDAELIKKVNEYLKEYDLTGLDIRIMSPDEATRFSCQYIKEGKDTISVTGNVLRDYLTDLFPILEVGTSAKMLSIVPLMNGGGLFETGAGGSAPKHVEQFLNEGHLRWDSLGEFLAISASLEHLANRTGNEKARVLSQTLDRANGRFLESNRSPGRDVNEIDNRGSHFYLTMFWARELADQNDDPELKSIFTPVAEQLEGNEDKILQELNAAQGHPVDIGGYYKPDDDMASRAMRPSQTYNAIIDSI